MGIQGPALLFPRGWGVEVGERGLLGKALCNHDSLIHFTLLTCALSELRSGLEAGERCVWRAGGDRDPEGYSL